MSQHTDVFSDPQAVARYTEGPPRMVPGFADLHRMTMLLLAERASKDARVLVVGAGGGLEIRSLAEAQPGWSFVGVDPAAEMLSLAIKTLGSLMSRAGFHQGFVNDAPIESFDGATCLLTLHFVPATERVRMLEEVRRRLRPMAPLVVAHLSIPGDRAEREMWLTRYASFAQLDAEQLEAIRSSLGSRLHALSPTEDESQLRDAGFVDINLFYVGFAFRGWVAYAPHTESPSLKENTR